MTADFFGATLTASSYDLQEKSDHGKEEQVQEKAFSGKSQTWPGQAQRSQEERREKEIATGEGEGEGQEGGEKSRKGREEGRQSGSQEGQGQSQAFAQEDCAQATEARTDAESAATRSACVNSVDRARGIEHGFCNGADGDLNNRRGMLGAYQPLERGARRCCRERRG